MLCYAKLRDAMLCCAMLRYAMVCGAMLWYEVPRYATLRCAMLCSAMRWISDSKMKLRGRTWGNRGADPGGTARGDIHCPAPSS
eukprot:6501719-Pyramimonas_sp.AAC.1